MEADVLLEEFNCPMSGLGRLGVTSDAGDACYNRLRARYTAAPNEGLKFELTRLDAVYRAALNPTSQFEGRNWYLDDYNREACFVESLYPVATTPSTWITAIDRPSTPNETLPTPSRAPGSALTPSVQQLMLRMKGPIAMADPRLSFNYQVAPAGLDEQQAFTDPSPAAQASYLESAATKIVQNNPAALNNPAPGTTPVHPAQVSSNLYNNIFGLLTVGASELQKFQVTQAMLSAQKQGKVLYVPTSVVNQAQRQSTSPWVYAGAGVAALAIIGLVIYSARKS